MFAQDYTNILIGNKYESKNLTNDVDCTTTLYFKSNVNGEITTTMTIMGKRITKKNPFTYSVKKSILTYKYSIDGEVWNEKFDILQDKLISRDYVGIGDKKLIYRKVN
jgi:hypothetical protein